MSIFIPEDRYLYGAHYTVAWVDNNEAIATGAGTSVYISLPQKGFGHGIAAFGNPADVLVGYVYEFNTTTAKAFGVGGRASSTGDTYGYRSRQHLTVLSDTGEFGTNIRLVDLYIDNANERIVTTWSSTSGSQTLSARATFLVRKGEHV